ncbi:MAG TPA: 2-C-methyl-D-erythritol 4-phosphate cytidylyltransferase [Vicinamibacterales bacterium]|jgi:2-C-methyl-D-erythritol 4-phosphate cytidylyltransferase/2-C-methyl-D-erythritol 2,4-cyclodiphosphate synthase|nr:2-C-methyl-D-erythritol 4-phosphate cytidylyltransferase [Vicinamibacterales bacterium]
MQVTAIIAAGGAGVRIGASTPKQFLDLGGKSILERSVAAFDDHPDVTELIIVLPPDSGRNPYAPPSTRHPVRIVTGGRRRQDSVANAFDAVDAAADVVLVHDAARPFVTAEVITRTIRAAAEHGAAIAAIEASDTIKRVRRTGSNKVIVETIPRDTIYLAQTPQGFRRDVLAAAVALGRSGVDATDEAALAERAGHSVHLIEGDPGNVKITTADDLHAARQRAGGRARTGRAGTGYDLHRLVDGRPLILAGVTIPSERGALGHSDADVVCHAATDAILGAAGLGDIGRHFPDSDPRWKDASSLVLLEQAASLARAAGYEVGNLDVTVILERPKIKDHVDDMRGRMAAAIGIDPSRVSIKGKTNEGVDAVGRGEAIAAHAIALIRSRSDASR